MMTCLSAGMIVKICGNSRVVCRRIRDSFSFEVASALVSQLHSD